MSESIEKFILGRNIDTLLHFTSLENLPGICEDGLIPRSKLISREATFRPTDFGRPDAEHPFNCLSIEHTNWRMHYKYFESARAVLEIRAKPILTDSKSIFTPTNASRTGQLEKARGGLIGLKALFDGERAEGMPARYPSDAQAEVLFPATIPLKYIRTICLNSDGDRDAVRKLVKKSNFSGDVIVKPLWFKPRAF